MENYDSPVNEEYQKFRLLLTSSGMDVEVSTERILRFSIMGRRKTGEPFVLHA
jgi:hypothetical protein